MRGRNFPEDQAIEWKIEFDHAGHELPDSNPIPRK